MDLTRDAKNCANLWILWSPFCDRILVTKTRPPPLKCIAAVATWWAQNRDHFFENSGPFGSQYGWSVALAPSPCLDLFGVCKRHSESGQPEGTLTCRISPHMIALEGSDKDRRLCASLHTCVVFLATEPRSRKQSGISILKQEMRPNLGPNIGAKN